MKKSTLNQAFIFFTIFCLSFLKSNGQYSLQTARNCNFYTTLTPPLNLDSLPPLSSTLPIGPYYGNMNTTSRPLWFYFPLCVSAKNASFYIADYFLQSNYYPDLSIAAWGPFDDISGLALTDLDSSKLLVTYNLNFFSFSFNSPNLPKVDSGKVYIMVMTTNDTTTNNSINFTLYVQPRFSYAGSIAYTESCYLCNGKATYIEKYENICNITVDTPSNHISLIWEKDASDKGIYGYIIKIKNTMGVYDSIAFVPYNNFSAYTDITVNALQQKRYYQVVPVDSCLNEYPAWPNGGNMVSAIYLQSYPGLNNVVNLTWDWDRFYIKYSIPVFYVWRSSNYGAFQLVDSLPATGGLPYTEYYTDINVPAGPATYMIEVRQSTACFPSLIATGGSSYSNPSGVLVLGENEQVDYSQIRLQPNLTHHGIVTIITGQPLKHPLDMLTFTAEGKQVEKTRIPGGEINHTYNTKHLAAGVYYLHFANNEISKILKLVIY